MARRPDFADLDVFLAIARAGGFRRAAAQRGVSGSALSHTIRGLEARLGVRLFHRTSRSVSLTAAGQMLLDDLEPRFQGIADALDRLDGLKATPSGRVRITALRDAARLLIEPKLPGFLERYPDIDVEIVVDDRFVDMVADGFDAGIRYGGTVPEGMVAARLTRELDWVVVGAPAYFAAHGRPQTPDDLLSHRCIRIRTGANRIYKWEFERGEEVRALDVPGRLTLEETEISIRMAAAGAGLFYCLRDRAGDLIGSGALETVLDDWIARGPGFHAYYVSHRQVPLALRLLLDHLKEERAAPPSRP